MTTEYVPSSTVSPVNSTRSSSRRKHRWFGRVAGRVQHLEPELGAVDRVAVADHAVGDDVDVLVDASPNASTSAPVALTSRVGAPASGRGACG